MKARYRYAWIPMSVAAAVLAFFVTVSYWAVRHEGGEYNPPGKIERKIADTIDHCPPAKECRLRLADVTRFDWDRVYVFGDGTSDREMSAIIGVPLNTGGDGILPHLVFTKGMRVVHCEEMAWALEHGPDRGVTFDAPLQRHWLSYPHNAEFIASKIPEGDNTYYSLLSVNVMAF